MTSYNAYPNLPWGHAETPGPNGPSAPPPQSRLQGPENLQVGYHLNVVQAKRTRILNRFTWLNACSSRISVVTGIASVATFTTFMGLPVSILLGAASLTGTIASGIISALTKKYQKKLKNVTKLIDIITPALAVFERAVCLVH